MNKKMTPYSFFIVSHEVAHLEIAKFLKRPVNRFYINTEHPIPTSDNHISLGHITYKPRNFLDNVIVGLGGYFLWVYWIAKHWPLMLKLALNHHLLFSEIKQLFFHLRVED